MSATTNEAAALPSAKDRVYPPRLGVLWVVVTDRDFPGLG
jgi:hypothetical protein